MSPFLEWNDNYLTGIAEIDADHQKLFAAVNALHDADAIGDTDAHFAELFDMLAHYVDTHFAREEELMTGLGYPNLEAHLVGHQELRTTVHEMARRYHDDPGAVSHKEVLKFLSNWLSGHILESDMDYVSYIKPDSGSTAAA